MSVVMNWFQWERFLEAYLVADIMACIEGAFFRWGVPDEWVKHELDKRLDLRWMWRDSEDAYEASMDWLKQAATEEQLEQIEREGYDCGGLWAEAAGEVWDLAHQYRWWTHRQSRCGELVEWRNAYTTGPRIPYTMRW